MKFVPSTLDRDNGRVSTTIYTPAPEEADNSAIDYSEITIDGQSRKTLPGLLRLLEQFGLDQTERERRTELGQDCTAFGYAWEQYDSVDELQICKDQQRLVSFGRMTSEIARIGDSKDLIAEPDVAAGAILVTSPELPGSENFYSGIHVLVRATEGLEDPLYISKFCKWGPVAVHRLQDSINFFPARSIVRVADLWLNEPKGNLQLQLSLTG